MGKWSADEKRTIRLESIDQNHGTEAGNSFPPNLRSSWHCEYFQIVIYNTHGHKLRFPLSKKAQFVTECGIVRDVVGNRAINLTNSNELQNSMVSLFDVVRF
jgi:hypothetical protein